MEVVGQTKYRKIKKIGSGNFGEVWEAVDIHSGGTVAVKEIPRSKLAAQRLSDFFAEAKAMEASGNHQNVILIRYACDCPTEDKIGLVMPLYRKGSLNERIENGPLSLREVVRTTLAWLNGLHQIHLAGYIHYDIKPSNILFSDGGNPMVADFGQTRLIQSDGTSRLPPLYPDSVPPEFFTGSVGTVETDIYHAGLTIYRTANGNPQYRSQLPADDNELRADTLAGAFPDRDYYLPHVPTALRQVIRKALSVSPADRYPSATELQDAVANVTVDLDWRVNLRSDGSAVWVADRVDQPSLVVELEPEAGKWAVKQFTANGGARRGRKVDEWGRALTRTQAITSLKKLFRSLK